MTTLGKVAASSKKGIKIKLNLLLKSTKLLDDKLDIKKKKLFCKDSTKDVFERMMLDL